MNDASSPGSAGHAPEPSAAVSVDLDAIADNVRVLREHAGSAQVMAVVKADGYGHGLVPSAQASLAGGAAWLGVAQLAEAITLRDAGVNAPILTWLYAPGADVAGALARDIDVTVSSPWQVEAVVAAARALGKRARIQLKVDTGLARGGALLDSADGSAWQALVDLVAPLVAEEVVQIGGTWTHFVHADAPEHPTVRGQQQTFAEAVAILRRKGLDPGLQHCANSAATLTNPSAHLDLVRPGLAVYGLSPVPDLGGPAAYGLREAMRVTARLSLVKRVRAGQGISYGHTAIVERDTVIGLVPMGYADGIPRNGSNLGPVRVAGVRTPVLGRVCMDQFLVDLGPDFDGSAGDEVVVLGREAEGEPSAQDWAAATGTINYEIVTRMSSRLPRIYLGGGR